MPLWRISNHISLAGDGGLRASARWHTRGRRIVYCAQSPAAALLETLVHFELDLADLPMRYRLLKLEGPDDLIVERVSLADLPREWVTRTDITRAAGDLWLSARRSPLLAVPSVLVPETFNTLLNPSHPDAGRLRVTQASDHVIDSRLVHV